MAKAKTSKKSAPARKTPPARKPAPRKPAARKPAGKAPKKGPAPAAKPAPRKAPAKPARPVRPPARKAAVEVQPEPKKIRTPLSAKELELFRKQLLNLRDRAVDEISFLAGENLNHSQRESSGDLSNYGIHMADQGTDNFDREFALSLVSNEHDVVYEIDEALHRIEMKTYGVCEMTGQPIDIARLKVMPYTRYCRAAQEEMERGRKKYRPFGATMIQTPEAP